MAKILIENKSFKVELNKEPTPQVLELLDNTTLGTTGAQYAHKNIRERIKHTKNPYFLTLYRHDKIWGNITFSHREIDTPSGKVNAYYIRYFAFSNGLKSAGRKDKKKHQKQDTGSSTLKKFVNIIFNRGIYQEDYNYGENPDIPFVYYAYIDDDNLRSMNMGEAFDFETVGKFATISFSRINPNRVKGIEKLKVQDRISFREKFFQYYKDYSFTDFHDLFRDDNYYVLKAENETLIGAQVHNCHWEIKSMGSPVKDFLLKFLTMIPGISNWFNPKKLYFINIDHLYVNEGYEEAIFPFFTGLLSIKGMNLAMVWLDLRDPMANYLLESNKLGPIARFQSVTPANILVKFSKDVTAEQRQFLSDKTVFLSGYDMT